METAEITMPVEEAKKHYKEYLDATKVRKEKYVEELKNLYRHLSEGMKVLDIYKVFNQSGLNEKGQPKLAIAPASVKKITFNKSLLGAGNFAQDSWKDTVALPSGTFHDWEVYTKENADEESWAMREGAIVDKTLETQVPVIPPILLPESKSLDGYYVLFEVTEWNVQPIPEDPYFLKRINANAFVVLGEWDVTDVELAVMRGQ